ncbi:unnamed protein product [Closterium sp. Yama58-4]|nr:unnamed protein product [Closterium sp. Yama58-4]
MSVEASERISSTPAASHFTSSAHRGGNSGAVSGGKPSAIATAKSAGGGNAGGAASENLPGLKAGKGSGGGGSQSGSGAGGTGGTHGVGGGGGGGGAGGGTLGERSSMVGGGLGGGGTGTGGFSSAGVSVGGIGGSSNAGGGMGGGSIGSISPITGGAGGGGGGGGAVGAGAGAGGGGGSSSQSLGAQPSLLSNGAAPGGSFEAERLRTYRQWFHELDSQRSELISSGTKGPVLKLLECEIRCLEELVMLGTKLGALCCSPIGGEAARLSAPAATAIPGKPRLGGGVDSWPSDDPLSPVDGLDLSLVTDMLLLSATSPWTVYVADRTNWRLCYVSPSVRATLGWRQAELVGEHAFAACHADDLPRIQRMIDDLPSRRLTEDRRLLDDRRSPPLSLTPPTASAAARLFRSGSAGSPRGVGVGDSLGSSPGGSAGGGCIFYRRLRRNRSYATVQATGRALGARWFAWIEFVTDDSSAPLSLDNWSSDLTMSPSTLLSPMESPSSPHTIAAALKRRPGGMGSSSLSAGGLSAGGLSGGGLGGGGLSGGG